MFITIQPIKGTGKNQLKQNDYACIKNNFNNIILKKNT